MSDPGGFRARSLQHRYAFVDRCPEGLLPILLPLSFWTLERRVHWARAWWDLLLAGQLPSPDDWPDPEILQPAVRALSSLGIARFCKGQPDLVAEVMRSVVGAVARGEEELELDVARELRELETLERKRLVALKEPKGEEKDELSASPSLPPEVVERLRVAARARVRAVPRGLDMALVEEWAERLRVWSELSGIFDDLGELLGRGQDLTCAVLRHAGWSDLVRLRKLIAGLPQVSEIVRTLGRLQQGGEQPSISELVFSPVRVLEEERRQVSTPLVPMETRGVQRSAEVARMLPAEAALLGHPRLKLLWHARRAESALATYLVEGTEERIELVESTRQLSSEKLNPREERGPVLVVLDTSGSMHGMPEAVAKALALEALRTAHSERRACFLYLYSGPGNIVELGLDLTADGIVRLLDFLGFTFGGGNDETGVMARVVARLRQAEWKRADVLFVSDGEWAAPAALVEMVASARSSGVRFHGVQIGNVGTTGLHAICEPVHLFRDWVAMGTST